MPPLELVEIRTLDGANIFLQQPVIKLQLRVGVLSEAALAAAKARRDRLLAPFMTSMDHLPGVDGSPTVGHWLIYPSVNQLHRALGLAPFAAAMDRDYREFREPAGMREEVVAFGWEWRSCAEGIARAAVEIAQAALGDEAFDLAATLDALRRDLATDRAEGDRPLFIRDAERRIPLVGITGTNGKTTTTRCLAHILATTGRRVGMANSNGVWIGDEQVLAGDYTGPQGARRVLEEDSVDVAVLETARGGILLRGIAYESNDVGVITNVSADHLGLQGIDTVEDLARVKSLVVRLTRPDGLAVLNGDDPLVRAIAPKLRAPVLLFSRQPDSAPVRDHLAAGGRVLLADEGVIVLADGASRRRIAALADVPITFGGRAGHMVENALAAVGAALGLGLAPEEIAAGLTNFRNSPEQNFGRLNVFAIREPACTFVVDYAHNEAGLEQLLSFGRGFVAPGARLLAIIGTAGDRPDSALRAIGRLAAEEADRIWIRETEHYLRGRTREEMNALFAAGIAEGPGSAARETPIVPDELVAVETALAEARAGDAIVMMCFEQQAEVLARLGEVGVGVTG